MSYEALSLSGFVNELKDVSSGPHSRKFCFVLGAGASRTSGIKSGQDLVDLWEKELLERNCDDCASWKAELGISDSNKYSFYSHFYEKRFKRNPPDGYNYLEKLMEHAKPSSGYVVLSHLLTETNHNVVITTNFDHLMENAVSYYTQTLPLVIGHESLSHYITKKLKRPTVVKIHRDLLFNPANRVDEVDSLHTDWKKALDVIFAEYHPIIIGYAGNDNSLMNYLVDNSERFSRNELSCPYWMLYKNDAVEGKIRDFLDLSNGYCVRHGGFDELMFLIGAAFGYKVPSKDKFLNDAEKRYQMLSDSFDAFTDKQKAQAELENNGQATQIDQAIQQITDQTELQRIYREAVFAHNAGKYEEALPMKEKLITLSPDNARYRDSLGITLHEMKRYDEAATEKHRAVDLEPDSAKYHYSLGVTLHEMKRYDAAAAESQKAVDLEPDNARYRDSLGVTLHEMKRYDEAAAEKQRAVDLEPDNARYRDSLGVTLHEMKRYDEAVTQKYKAVDLEPDNARYHNNLGNTLHEMRRYDEAVAQKYKAVDLEPDNARYHDNLSVTLHTMQRYDEAVAEKQRAVDLEPDNASYHYSLGVTLHEMKRYDEAAAETQKAVDLEPDSAKCHYSLGVTLHAMQRYDEAAAQKQKAVDLEPDNARYRNSLGCTLHAIQRYDEAAAQKYKAVDLEPDNARYHDNLSVTLHTMQRYDEAVAETQKAIDLEPDSAAYHYSLGITLHEMKRYDEAAAEIQKAVDLDPDNARYRNNLDATLRELAQSEPDHA